MATYTPNFNLSKPANGDTMSATVKAYRDNLDIIDANLGGGGGGGNADVVHLSQEEYDALPASKTSDHKIYMIEDTFSEGELGRINVNGMFIDTTNVLGSGTWLSPFSYTAVQDCFVYLDGDLDNSHFVVNINGVKIYDIGSSSYVEQMLLFPLKKGQTLTATRTTNYALNYAIYGIQPASNVVIIPDYLSSCYSTSERQIGCWRDGKPIYQKTFEFASPITVSYNSWTDTNISVSGNNIDKVISAVGYNANEKAHWNVDTSLEVSSYVSLLTGRNGDTISVKYLTLQYTKTTDTAGGGEWTPHGTPTVHYSTEETCIGTWIDGKPLYQKTINTGNLPNNGSINLTTPNNLKLIIDAWGVIYNVNDNSYQRLLPFSAGGGNDIRVDINLGTLRIVTFADWTAYQGYLTIQYTKTTD